MAESIDHSSPQEHEQTDESPFNTEHNLQRRSRTMLRKSEQKNDLRQACSERNGQRIRVMAMGPLGHIYLPNRPGTEEMDHYAKRLVERGNIPLVCYVENGRVQCVNHSGTGELSLRAEHVLGSSHPSSETAADMEHVCRHPNAGDFVISGWRPDETPLTFPTENGSHGGPGSQETRGFLIIPESLQKAQKNHYRPTDLRQALLEVLGKRKPNTIKSLRPGSAATTKVMTYNVPAALGPTDFFPGEWHGLSNDSPLIL